MLSHTNKRNYHTIIGFKIVQEKCGKKKIISSGIDREQLGNIFAGSSELRRFPQLVKSTNKLICSHTTDYYGLNSSAVQSLHAIIVEFK